MVVTKKEGKTYAFNNKCPHLGLSLKRGEITGTDDRHGVCVRVRASVYVFLRMSVEGGARYIYVFVSVYVYDLTNRALFRTCMSLLIMAILSQRIPV